MVGERLYGMDKCRKGKAAFPNHPRIDKASFFIASNVFSSENDPVKSLSFLDSVVPFVKLVLLDVKLCQVVRRRLAD